MLKIGLLILVSPFLSQPVQAQNSNEKSNTEINQQIWIDFYPHYYVNEKLEYYGDSGFRTIIGDRSWNRLHIRPSIKYHIHKKWELHAGLGLFYIYDINNIDHYEITPWQGIQYNGSELKRINFNHLLKIEERWSILSNENYTNFEFRLRYKMSGKINLKNEKWAIPFYGEVFLPVTGEFQEIYQNKGRAGLGIEHQIAKDWKVSFICNWQRSKSGIDQEANISDYIYQVKIKKVWNSLLKLR